MAWRSAWLAATLVAAPSAFFSLGCAVEPAPGSDGVAAAGGSAGSAHGGAGGSGGHAGAGGSGAAGGSSGSGGSSGVGGTSGTGGSAGSSGAGGSAGLGGTGGLAGTGGSGASAGSAGAGGSAGSAGSGGLGGSGAIGGAGGLGGGGVGGLVDPDCVDGETYASETIPTRANVDDLVAQYTPAERQTFAVQVLERRYPTGAYILREANNKSDCFEIAFSDTSTAEKIIAGLRTAVHECGHMIDLNQPTRFVLREDLQYTCDFSIPRSGPPRGIILNDEYQALWPKDSFKDLYLDELGDQTFEALLNEASQYINTLATSYAFYDFTTFDPIARDGVHAFYWYVMRFLKKTRLENTASYEALTGDSCWRQLVLALWGRAHRYLVETKGLSGLGGQDDALLQELHSEPVLLEEIQALRVLDGCT